MIDLSSIKTALLRRVLEESENFKALEEGHKPNYVNRMAALPEKEQLEMAKFMIKNEQGLGKKVLMSFLQYVGNATSALTNVAAKDRSIMNKMKADRSATTASL